MRYELVRLAQLVFALTMMFGAFVCGLTIGWLRWGRALPDRHDSVAAEEEVPRIVKPDLFSPAVVPSMTAEARRPAAVLELQRWTIDAEPVDAELVVDLTEASHDAGPRSAS
jgi:hypothetical protein